MNIIFALLLISFHISGISSAAGTTENMISRTHPPTYGNQDVFHGNNFLDIVNEKHFIDKTLMINEFFQRSAVFLLQAPRRFGKTTNLDMLKTFCELIVDDQGKPLPKEKNPFYKVFSSKYPRKNNEEHLKIYNETEVFDKHFGRYPVISLNFAFLNTKNIEDFKISFAKMIIGTFRMHNYVIKMLNEEDEGTFNACTEATNFKTNESQLETCLVELANFLCDAFHAPVIVLIDEFDAHIQLAIFEKSYNNFEEISDVIANAVGLLLKHTKSVKRGCLVSCFRAQGIRSVMNANNIEQMSFNSFHRFKPYFGFSESEVKCLLSRFELDRNFQLVKEWYHGYSVPGSRLTLYNPYSIVEYLETGVFGQYWVNTGVPQQLNPIQLFDRVNKIISSIINGGAYEIKKRFWIETEEIKALAKLVNKQKVSKPKSFKINDYEVGCYIYFLLECGYLTTSNVNGSIMCLKVPNLEIKEILNSS